MHPYLETLFLGHVSEEQTQRERSGGVLPHHIHVLQEVLIENRTGHASRTTQAHHHHQQQQEENDLGLGRINETREEVKIAVNRHVRDWVRSETEYLI